MKGQFLHNQVIIATLLLALNALGYRVQLEHPARPGQRPPAVDLFVVVRGRRTVIEVECSAVRVSNDLRKAQELSADLLIIVVPHARVKKAVQSALKQLHRVAGEDRPKPQVEVLTLGAALRWIGNNCPPKAPRPTGGEHTNNTSCRKSNIP